MQQKKRCIGIFTASLDDGYQSTVWNAIEEGAQRRGFGTISFLGSRLGSPIASEASSNLAYHLANERNIDGLVIISSSLATFFSSVDLREFFAPWASLPRVSIGMSIPGMSDVIVEGSSAITSLVEHLIDVHKRKRFAIIGGPESHDEAIDRLHACVETLHKRGLPIDDQLIVPGTFTQDSGARSAQALLATGRAFDALICMNDRMAQGALEELALHGLQVPDDVSVIGFDGIESSRFMLPPLTTVEQPMHEMGIVAVDMLDRLMRGGDTEHVVLSCSPVIRESCGCGPRFSYTPDLKDIPQYATPHERMAIFDLMILVRKGDYDGLILRLNKAIDTSISEHGAVDRWNEYLSVIAHQCAGKEGLSPKELSRLMGAARALTGEKIGRYQASKRIATEASFETLRQVSAMLAGAFELDSMIRNLRKGLSLFGIDRGYLVGFDGLEGKGRLLMSMQEHPELDDGLSRDFEYHELLPPVLGREWQDGQWILLPLVHNDEPLGYLLVPIGIVIPALYDVLQEQVSSNLKGTLLMEQVRSHERILAEQVELRTRDLIKANRELSGEIKRRKELEHEVMEISGKTMERIGQDLHDDLCQHLLGISLLASSASKAMEDHHTLQPEILKQISELLSESITKIKTISRGLIPLEMEPHAFSQRLEALVGDTRRYSRTKITIHGDPRFEISDPDQALHVFRIIQEALTNAIRHAKASKVEIALGVAGSEEGRHTLVATISDNGVGIPKKIREGGLGLKIMHGRANMARAQLSIDSSADGTVVRVTIKGEESETSR